MQHPSQKLCQQMLHELGARQPVAKGKELIVANDGFWAEADPLDQKALFEFQLLEVTAIGWGASDALSIWLRQAKERYSQCIDQ